MNEVMRKTVTVAMTTYNGERYIFDQLLSIYDQTRKPDEVIICDDCSKDNTTKIIKSFIEEHNLQDKWKLTINSKNKGYVINFIDSANMGTGEIIFFCDQDDIWKAEKIEKMSREFEKNSKVKALTCTFDCIDSSGNKIDPFVHKLRRGNGRLQQISFEKHIRLCDCTGMTLAVTRKSFDYISPIIIAYELVFDIPIGALTAISGGFYSLGIPLVYRRLHSDNTSQPKLTIKSRIKKTNVQISGLKFRLNLFEKYLEIANNTMSEKDKVNLQKTIIYLKESIESFNKRKIIPMFLNLFTLNPMINRIYAFGNLMCSLIGQFEKNEVIE